MALAPVSRISNADPSSPTDAEYRLVGYVRDLFFRARTVRRPLVQRWARNYNVLWNRSAGYARASYEPDTRIPEIQPIVASMTGWMTDQRPTWEVTPAAAPHSPFANFYAQLGNDLQTVMQALWQSNDFEAEVEQMIWDGHVYGTGILKSAWDNTLAGGIGDATITRVDPWTWYPDPVAKRMDQANYFIEARNMSLQELDRRIPGAAAKIAQYGYTENVDESPTTVDETGTSISKAPNMGGLGSATTGRYGLVGQTDRENVPGALDQVTVLEAWLREHKLEVDERTNQTKVIDYWRLVIIFGNCVLMDVPALDIWSHGQHPYDRWVPIETGEMWGFSLVELLAPTQISINRLLGAMEHNIWLHGNPVFKEESRAGISRTLITNKPGQRITTNAGGQADWMTPPQIHPQLSSELVSFYKGEMENVSGLSAVTRGFTPTGRNAQGVMDSVQESAFVRVRLALRNLERTLRRTGNKVASLIVEYYDTPRMIQITGDDGEKSSLALKGRHFYLPSDNGRIPMRFQLLVQAGSLLPTSRQARVAEADTLYAMGAIDEEAVLEAHNYPNRQIITARVRELKAMNGTLGQPPNARQSTRRTT